VDVLVVKPGRVVGRSVELAVRFYRVANLGNAEVVFREEVQELILVIVAVSVDVVDVDCGCKFVEVI